MSKLKRIISSVLTATMLMGTITIAPFTVSAKETEETTTYQSNIEFVTESPKTVTPVGASYTENGFTYEVTNNQATVTGYNNSNITSLYLPESLGGYPVATIGNNAFSNYANLTTVVIPNSVTKINAGAFLACKNLSNVTLSKSLEEMGAYAFGDCDSLTNIQIPKSLKNTTDAYYYEYIYGYCFGVFIACDNLKNITFESGTTKIPVGLFANNSSIETITIPNTVTTIENCAFQHCENLSNVTLSSSLVSIGSQAFKGTSIKSIVIPDTVKQVSDGAFLACKNLSNVTLSKSLEEMGAYAFGDCDSLTSIVIPKSLKKTTDAYYYEYIYGYCFGVFIACDNLKNITFESGTTKIPVGLFANNNSIETITIPDTVTSIENCAFQNCKNLKSIYLPANIQNTGDYAFDGCDNLIIYSPKFTKTTIYLIDNGIPVCSSNDNRIEEPTAIVDTDSYYIVKSGSKVTFVCSYKIKDSVYKNISNTSIKIKIPDDTYICENSLHLDKNKCTNFIEGDGYIDIPVTEQSGKISFDLDITTGTNLNTYALFNYKLKTSSGNDEIEFKANTAYVKADNDWSNLHCYMWNSSKDVNATWPGVKMDYVGNNIYSYTYSKEYANIIFNNGNSGNANQTKDLTYPGDGYLYTISQDYWKQSSAVFVTGFDIIDVMTEEMPIISVTTKPITSTDNVQINGIAPSSSDVKIYVDDVYTDTFTTNKAGSYSGNIILSNVEENKKYNVKAISEHNGETIEATCSLLYQKNSPKLTEFTMVYNDKTYDLMSDKKHSVTFILEEYHGAHPFKFIAKYSDAEEIAKVVVTSTRNQVTKKLNAVYDEKTDSFIAEGYFDETNHDYVPGKIDISYVLKPDKSALEEDLDITYDDLPEEWKNSEVTVLKNNTEGCEIEIKLSEESTVTYTQNDNLTLAELRNKYLKTTTINKNNVEPVGMPEDVATEAVIDFIEDLGEEYRDNVISNAKELSEENDDESLIAIIKDEPKQTLTTILWDSGRDAFISTGITFAGTKAIYDNSIGLSWKESGSVWGVMYGMAKPVFEFAVIDQEKIGNAEYDILSSTTLTASQKEYALKKTQQVEWAYAGLALTKSAVAVASYYVSLQCGPLAPVINLGLNLITDMAFEMIEDYLDDSLAYYKSGGKGSLFNWSIDPSGYVYAGVTNNRIPDVKVTAYWIPVDDTDENFWNLSPDDSKAILWDANEYSQINPLYTDATGNYAWDVPEGWWKVVCEKEGYETYTTEWLPVPPPQTDVNINLMSKEVPVVENISATNSSITLDFSMYMKPETIHNIVITDGKGNVINYTLDYSTQETDLNGTVYATSFTLNFDENYTPATNTFTLKINNVESYAGVKALNTDKTATILLTGDINLNGAIDITDATELQKHLAQLTTLTDKQLSVADVNENGTVDIKDVTTIQKYLAGLVTELG